LELVEQHEALMELETQEIIQLLVLLLQQVVVMVLVEQVVQRRSLVDPVDLEVVEQD
jgi:hypothetical protein